MLPKPSIPFWIECVILISDCNGDNMTAFIKTHRTVHTHTVLVIFTVHKF